LNCSSKCRLSRDTAEFTFPVAFQIASNDAKIDHCRFGGEKRELSLVARKISKFLIVNLLKYSIGFLGQHSRSPHAAGLSVGVSSMAMRSGTSTHPVRGRLDLQSDADHVGAEVANLILGRNRDETLPHVTGVVRHWPPFALFMKAAEGHRKCHPGRIGYITLQQTEPTPRSQVAACRGGCVCGAT
jgi:hypothetical protein